MKNSLDSYIMQPEGKMAYLSAYGWHFNKKACDFAVSLMKKKNTATGKDEKIEPYSKEAVIELLTKNNVKLDKDVLYDSTYAANMCKADFYKSSIPDEAHLALYVKDVIDDTDAGDGTLMRRWVAGMVAAGEPIEWEDLL